MRFYFKIFSIADLFCNVKNKSLDPFNNLMSKLIANSLSFICYFYFFNFYS